MVIDFPQNIYTFLWNETNHLLGLERALILSVIVEAADSETTYMNGSGRPTNLPLPPRKSIILVIIYSKTQEILQTDSSHRRWTNTFSHSENPESLLKGKSHQRERVFSDNCANCRSAEFYLHYKRCENWDGWTTQLQSTPPFVVVFLRLLLLQLARR